MWWDAGFPFFVPENALLVAVLFEVKSATVVSAAALEPVLEPPPEPLPEAETEAGSDENLLPALPFPPPQPKANESNRARGMARHFNALDPGRFLPVLAN